MRINLFRKRRLIPVMWSTIFLVGLFMFVSVRAEDLVQPEKTWKFNITPYVWFAGINGTAGIKGNDADVDSSFSDLSKFINKAYMGVVEADRRRLIFFVDGVYLKLNDSGAKSLSGTYGEIKAEGTAKVSFTEQIYQPSVGYRVLDNRIQLDAIAAERYTQLDTKLNLAVTTDIPEFPGRGRNISETLSWWDTVVGARVIWPFLPKWSAVAYGDIGGGGSNLTGQVFGSIKWQFGKNFSTSAGYRYLYQDYKNDTVKWDMATYGPIVGFGWNF